MFHKEERIKQLFDFVSTDSISTMFSTNYPRSVLIKMTGQERKLFQELFDTEFIVKPYFEWEGETNNTDYTLYLDIASKHHRLCDDAKKILTDSKTLFVNENSISDHFLFQLEEMKQGQFIQLRKLLNELNWPDEQYGKWILTNSNNLNFIFRDNKAPLPEPISGVLDESIKKYLINSELVLTSEDKKNLQQFNVINSLEENTAFKLSTSVLLILLKVLNKAEENKQIVIPHRLSANDYQISSILLGKGVYSSVYQGEYQNKHVAIKMANLQSKADRNVIIQSLLNEQRMLEKISEFRNQATYIEKEAADCLISSYGYDRGPSKMSLVITYANFGSVYNYITEGSKFSWQSAYTLFHDLMNGLSFLHNHGIIHRDIKPANLLLHKKEDNQLQLKLGDLGSARFETNGEFSICGSTPGYHAPE